MNFRDSIKTIFALSPYEYKLITAIDFSNPGKINTNEIANLYFSIAREKCLKAKSQEEKDMAFKSIEAALKYIKENKVENLNQYIKTSETYKLMLESK